MIIEDDVARGLVAAEHLLRGRGLTGARAFDVLIEGLVARVRGGAVSALAAEAAERVPLHVGADLIGLAYERFFPELFKGTLGQFFTPRPIVELALAHVDVAGRDVYDPTCGAGGFLVAAARAGARVRGVDVDPNLVALARTHMAYAGVDGVVEVSDAFATDVEPADIVLANPPFSIPIDDRAVLDRFGVDAPKVSSDTLFLRALPRWVRPGGGAAVVLPWSMLANSRHASIRDAIRRDFAVDRVVELPEGVFRPFGGAAGKAALVWLRRRPTTAARTRFARVEDPGYDVHSRRLVATGSVEVDERIAGRGFEDIGVDLFLPGAHDGPAVRLCDVARVVKESVRGPRLRGRTVTRLDLADADRRTGEVPRPPAVAGDELVGVRAVIPPRAVLVAKLRPELGAVAVAPDAHPGTELVVGSPEWAVFESEQPYFLATALRTPAFRAGLPSRTGQTRPRVDLAALLEAPVPWPPAALRDRVDRRVQALHLERARLDAALAAVEAAFRAWTDGALDDQGLAAALDAVDAATRDAPR